MTDPVSTAETPKPFLQRVLRVLTSPAAKRIYVVLLVLLVVFLWVNMVRRALKHSGSQYDDFIRFSRDLVYGRVNVYEEYRSDYTITKYPPFFSLLFAPLVPLPPIIGASVWFFLSLGLSVGATWLSVETIREKLDGSLGRAYYILPFLLTAGIIGSNLETAQVNIVIVFGICLALYTFRRGADITSGLLLAFVTALKLTPGLFIAYFAYKRAWKVVAGSLLGLIFFWLVIPPFVFGFENFADVMRAWVAVLNPFVTEGTIAEGIMGFRHTNQSMSAVLHRFFTETPADGGRGPGFYLNALSLSYETMDAIVKVLVLAIVAFLVWICRTPTERRGRVGLALEYSLVMIATLFISPISWINHYVILLFPYAAAVYYVRTRPADLKARRWMLYAIVASFVLVSTSASRLMQAFSLPWVGALVLAAGIAYALHRDRDARPRPLSIAS